MSSIQSSGFLDAMSALHQNEVQSRFSVVGAALALGGGAAAAIAPRWLPIATFAAGCFLLTPFFANNFPSNAELKDRIHLRWPSWALIGKTVAVATSAYFIYHATRILGSSCADNFQLQRSNPNRLQTFNMANQAAITRLETINTMPIPKIESRGRSGFSGAGFLGYTERFQDVLRRDWQTVEALGTTHIELAEHLKAIWKKTDQVSYDNSFLLEIRRDYTASKWGYPIFYNPSELKNNTIGTGPQLLFVKLIPSKGFQFDMFDKEHGNQSNYVGLPWSSILEIYNPINGVSLSVGSDLVKMSDREIIYFYLQKQGFFVGSNFHADLTMLEVDVNKIRDQHIQKYGYNVQVNTELSKSGDNMPGIVDYLQRHGCTVKVGKVLIKPGDDVRPFMGTIYKDGFSVHFDQDPSRESDDVRGVIDYIEKYGFYEGGGPNNPYRVDPVKLAALLTSQPVCDIQQAIGQTCGLQPGEQPISNREINRLLVENHQTCVCLKDVCTGVPKPSVEDPKQCLQL